MGSRGQVEINWVSAIASALAAVSSAVLLSTVGVAGTLIGAAVGSVIATVGSAVYAHYLEVSKARMAAAQVALERAARARADVRRAAATARSMEDPVERLRTQRELDDADVQLAGAEAELAEAGGEGDGEAEGRIAWRDNLSVLPWKRIVVVSLVVFVMAMGAILTFELLAGRAVSTLTGGSSDSTRTSIPGLGGAPQSEDPGREERRPTDAPTADATEPRGGGSSTPAPEAEPSPTPPEPTPPEPTPTTSPSASPSAPAPSAPEPSEGASSPDEPSVAPSPVEP